MVVYRIAILFLTFIKILWLSTEYGIIGFRWVSRKSQPAVDKTSILRSWLCLYMSRDWSQEMEHLQEKSIYVYTSTNMPQKVHQYAPQKVFPSMVSSTRNKDTKMVWHRGSDKHQFSLDDGYINVWFQRWQRWITRFEVSWIRKSHF